MMSYAVELFFDAASDARVREMWDRFAVAGRPSPGAGGSRPHVSLAVCETLDLAATEDLLGRFAEKTRDFALSFIRTGVFEGASRVIYLAPAPHPELKSLQRDFALEFTSMAGGLWEHYQPEAWIPHCTLAQGVPSHELGSSMDLELPLECVVTEVGLVEFRPVRGLFSKVLRGTKSMRSEPKNGSE